MHTGSAVVNRSMGDLSPWESSFSSLHKSIDILCSVAVTFHVFDMQDMTQTTTYRSHCSLPSLNQEYHHLWSQQIPFEGFSRNLRATCSSSTFKMPSRWSHIWWSYVQTCVKSLNYLLFTWKFNYSEVELFQNLCIKLDISSWKWCTQLEIWLIDATNLKYFNIGQVSFK